MAKWINRVVIGSLGSGTTTETYDPNSGTVLSGTSFVPTSGRFLVALIAGPVTSSTPSGWTLPTGGSAINNCGIYVWYKTASGSDTAISIHNGDGTFPTIIEFLEFPAGSTFVGSVASASVPVGTAGPTQSGLTGTNLLIGASSYGASGISNSWTWDIGVKDLDNGIGPSDKACEVTSSYLEDSTLTSVSMIPTRSSPSASTERLQFAINVAAAAAGKSPVIRRNPARGLVLR